MTERQTNPKPGRFEITQASRCFEPNICLLRLITANQKFDFPIHLLDVFIKDLKTNTITIVDLLGRSFTFHSSKLTAVRKLYRLSVSEVKDIIDSLGS